MLTTEDKRNLMAVAKASIRHGLEHRRPLPVNPVDFSGALQQPGASFVTLKINGELRGCIGSLQAWRPLVTDCADNAFNAAFRDPRFPPLGAREFELLHYHISILSPAAPMTFTSEDDLLAQLRPGIDGLVLEDCGHRGTFLPAVWEDLPLPRDFLNHLKRKAGLPMDYWSDSVQVSRYRVEDIEQ
jgi:uncharacterized protein